MPTPVWIICSIVVAWLTFFGVGFYADKCLDVRRSPERSLHYTLPEVSSPKARLYAVPVLFPLDLIVMLLLAASHGWAALYWGPGTLGIAPAWFLLAPSAYLVFDLAEDGLLAALLTGGLARNPPTLTILHVLTVSKLLALIVAMAIAILVGGIAAKRWLLG